MDDPKEDNTSHGLSSSNQTLFIDTKHILAREEEHFESAPKSNSAIDDNAIVYPFSKDEK